MFDAIGEHFYYIALNRWKSIYFGCII